MTAAAVAQTSSSSWTRSPVSAAEATTSVGARSSFAASLGPAASFRRASASGPRTRKRHGCVRWWFGASRATSSSSRTISRGTGSGPNALCVRRAAARSARLTPAGRRRGRSTPARRSSCENGQPSSAFARSACSASSSTPSAATTASTCDATIWWPCPSTSSMTIRHVTSSRPGGVPACVSSPASDIVMQPPCAAASSSSGLVFPSAWPMRVGSEKPRSANAPVPAEIAPAPRATFPSQTISCACARSAASGHRGRPRPCRRGSTPRPGSRRGGRRRAPASRRGPTFSSAVHEPRGQVDARAGAERCRLAADVERAGPFEHVDDLVVAVEVVGRAAGRDESDELRHARATGPSRRNMRPAVATPSLHRRRARRRRVSRRSRGADRGRAPTGSRAPSASLDAPRRPRGDVGRGAGPELGRSTADRRRAAAGEDVQHLVVRAVDVRVDPAAGAEQALLELLAAARGAEELRLLVRLDVQNASFASEYMGKPGKSGYSRGPAEGVAANRAYVGASKRT